MLSPTSPTQAPCAVPQIRQHAHRVKGAAGNLGMKALQETCALLEHNAKVRFHLRVHLDPQGPFHPITLFRTSLAPYLYAN